MRLEFQELVVAECITLAEAKDHCRIDGTAEDDYITDLIAKSRQHCENWCGNPLLPQTWKLFYDTSDCFIGKRFLRLPHSKVIRVTSINSYDSDNDSTEFDEDNYFLSGDRIVLNSSASFPSDVRDFDSLEIEIVSGFGVYDPEEEEEDQYQEAVPNAIKQAMLMLMLHWYENRAAVYDAMNTSVSTIITHMPQGVLALLQPYRRIAI